MQVETLQVRVGPARDITELDARTALSKEIEEWATTNPKATVDDVQIMTYPQLVYSVKQTNIEEYYYIIDASALIIYHISQTKEALAV